MVNDADLQEVIGAGFQINFDPFLYVFAFLPLPMYHGYYMNVLIG